MLSFDIRNMTDMIFGIDAENQCPKLVKEFGGSRVMIVHAGEPFVRPLIAKIRGMLEEAGLYCVELAGVVPNPRYEFAMEGTELCRGENIDFVLAVGGGSVIDTAKFIAFATKFEGDPWVMFNGQEITQKIYPALPIGVVSTFAGTGSEMTVGSVISRGKSKGVFEYILMRPKFCILDPKLTTTIPPFQTASGAADIFSHYLENFFTPIKDSDLAGNLITGGLRATLKHAPIAVEQPDNIESRSELMVLAPIAVSTYPKLGRCGDWGHHDLEHALSGEWDVPHGAGLAIVMPVWMRYVYRRDIYQFVKLGIEVFGLDASADLEQTALAAITATEEFLYNKLKLPRTMADLGFKDITKDDVRRISKHIFVHGNKTIGRTFPLEEEDCFKILCECCCVK